MSLLRSEKPLTVVIEGPVLHVSEGASGAKGKSRPFWPLPFPIEKGLALDGEILYRLREVPSIPGRSKALFAQQGDAFSFQAEVGEYAFRPATSGAPFGGRGFASVSGKGREVSIQQIGRRGDRVRHQGRREAAQSGPAHSGAQYGLQRRDRSHRPSSECSFRLGRQAEGRGRSGDEGRRAFLRCGHFQPGGHDERRCPWARSRAGSRSGARLGARWNLSLKKRYAPSESVLIRFGGGRVDGQVRGVHLDPILIYFKVPWPVRSPIWGNFFIVNEPAHSRRGIQGRSGGVRAPPISVPGKGAVRNGPPSQGPRFPRPDLDSSFGSVEVRGEVRSTGTWTWRSAGRSRTSSRPGLHFVYPEQRLRFSRRSGAGGRRTSRSPGTTISRASRPDLSCAGGIRQVRRGLRRGDARDPEGQRPRDVPGRRLGT